VFSVGALSRAFQRGQDDAELPMKIVARDDPVVVGFTERGATLWLTIDPYAQVYDTGQGPGNTGYWLETPNQRSSFRSHRLFRAPI
jgi:hypothetical protein